MMDRLMGVVMLKAPVYKEIAEDKSATTTAAIIVVVMALLTGVLGAVLFSALGSSLPPGTPQPSFLGFLVRTLVNTLVGWVVGAWVFAFVSKTFFGGRTDTGEMLRVFGFTQIFRIFGVVPCLGDLVGLVLSIIGAVIGIREASGFDTTKAILTGVIGLVVLFIVGSIVGLALAVVGLA